MDFKVKDGEIVRTVLCKKASATVIEAGDLVTLSSGLIIKAVAGSARVAYAPNGAGDGETDIDVSVGDNFTLVGTGDAVFAITHKGAEVDMVVNGGAQQIDLGESTTDVFRVGISKDAGTVDSVAAIEVRINKPLF